LNLEFMIGMYVSNTTLHLYGSYMWIYIYIMCIYIGTQFIVSTYTYIYTHPFTYVHSFSAKGIHDHLWLALGKPITWQMQWVSMPMNHSRVSCFHTSPSIGGTKISRSIGKHSIYHIYLMVYIKWYNQYCVLAAICIHVYTHIYMPTTVLYTYIKTTKYRWI